MPHKNLIDAAKKANKAVRSFSAGFGEGQTKSNKRIKKAVKGALSGGLSEARGKELEANRRARQRRSKK